MSEFDPAVIEAAAEAIHANRYAGQPRPPFTPTAWEAQDEKIRERYRLQAVAALDVFRLRVPYQEEAR